MKNVWGDCEISMSNGYDLVVKIMPLFGAEVYVFTKEAHDVVRHLRWSGSRYSATAASFYFFPVTESEIAVLLSRAFRNLEIFTTIRYPSG
ncbi:MAG: hypothetical protein NT155_01745 [Candidatus Staskawiczbacteria bacterium]|nr:hypothetical protein [Candidatus Staskawiczbacteria bacterium]